MKIRERFFVGVLIIASMLSAPAKTKAGPIRDYLNEYFGRDKDDKQEARTDRGRPHSNDPYRPWDEAWEREHGRDKYKPFPPGQGNSVPINGGLVILLAAGLGLGAKVMYDDNAKKAKAVAL